MDTVLLRTIIAFLFTSSFTTFGAIAKSTEAPLPEGIWEAEPAPSGTVGINLWGVSSSLGHGAPSDPGEIEHPILQVGVYLRTGAKVRCGEENFFDSGWRGHKDPGVRTTFTNGVLTVTYPQFPHETAMDLALSWHPDTDTWSGRFHRGSFEEVVVLHRAPDRRTHDQELCLGPSVIPR
jgi:hypothetical protein